MLSHTQNLNSPEAIHKKELAKAIHDRMLMQERTENKVWTWHNFAPSAVPGEEPKQVVKVRLTLAEIESGVELLLNSNKRDVLYIDNERARTKGLGSYNAMSINVNSVTNTWKHQGHISKNSKTLDQQKEETILLLKQNLILGNIETARSPDQIQSETKKQLQVIKSVIDATAEEKNGKSPPCVKNLVKNYQNCLGDMVIVEQWANQVWQQRGVGVEKLKAA